jgi:hypothetical protein
MAANAQPPADTELSPEKVASSICKVTAEQTHWLNPKDKGAWIEACEGGRVGLADLQVSHQTQPGWALASVHVTTAGPLVDTETIRVTFTVGSQSFPAGGSGIGLRMQDVYFSPCAQPVPVSAVASWRTKPLGTPARSFDFSTQINTTYANYANAVVTIPHADPWWSEGTIQVHRDSFVVYVHNFTPDRTYTLIKAEFLCVGPDYASWRQCQSGDTWFVGNSTPLPLTLTCGQEAAFEVGSEQRAYPLLAIFTYEDEGHVLNAVTAVILFVGGGG